MKLFGIVVSMLAAAFMRKQWDSLRAKVDAALIAQASSAVSASLVTQQLLLLGEDHRFFRHGGIDLIAVCRVIWRRFTRRSFEGASTIEMQLVRVLSCRYERTLSRKLAEMALATLLSRYVQKTRLPSLYLQVGYYGWHMNGLQQAAKRIGGKLPFTMYECARLVARLKYPEPQHPGHVRRFQIDNRARYLMYLWERRRGNVSFAKLTSPSSYASI